MNNGLRDFQLGLLKRSHSRLTNDGIHGHVGAGWGKSEDVREKQDEGSGNEKRKPLNWVFLVVSRLNN
jgi:hypothetical protein